MNNQKLLVAQVQLKEITEKTNTTLSTDETPKAGKVFMGYTVQVDVLGF